MNDLSQAWARNRLKHNHANSGDITAHWCRFLQRNQAQVSTLDWTAFRILSDDDSVWQTATLSMRRGAQAAQWNQLHQFEEIFFELSSLDKRRSYKVLDEYLTNNAPALVRLSRYEPFLELDPADAKSTDSTQLVVSLAKITVCSSYRRHEVLARTLDRISEEPIRWRRAAIEVLKQPKFTAIEADILKHIVSMLPFEDMHIERLRSRRRKFQLRHGWKIVIHRARRLSMPIAGIAMLMGAAALAFVFVEGTPTNIPDKTSEELRQQALEKTHRDIIEEFENRKAAKPVDVESPLASPTTAMSNQVKAMQLRWRETAIDEGNAGLDRIRTELQQQLSLANETGSQLEAKAQLAYLDQFDAWRRVVGNALAARNNSTDSGR